MNTLTEEQDIQHIATTQQLLKRFSRVEGCLLKLENYESADMTYEQINQELQILQESARCLHLFSPNEPIKEIHTEIMSLLLIPYYRGDVLGKLPGLQQRRQNLQLSRNYLMAFIRLCEHYRGDCSTEEEENLFPKNLLKTWKKYQEDPNHKIERDQLVTNEKEKRVIRLRYENNEKIKEHSDKRHSILDWITLNLYEAISHIRMIAEEMQILAYRQSIKNDPKAMEQHESQQNRAIPKMKVINIRKPQQIQQQFFLPTQHPKCLHCSSQNERKQLISKVWQPNSNQPTMTLQEVADMEMENLRIRTEREKKYREENKQDSDSDKEEVDQRKKVEARNWDDWKDEHEKGAGNKNQY